MKCETHCLTVRLYAVWSVCIWYETEYFFLGITVAFYRCCLEFNAHFQRFFDSRAFETRIVMNVYLAQMFQWVSLFSFSQMASSQANSSGMTVYTKMKEKNAILLRKSQNLSDKKENTIQQKHLMSYALTTPHATLILTLVCATMLYQHMHP